MSSFRNRDEGNCSVGSIIRFLGLFVISE